MKGNFIQGTNLQGKKCDGIIIDTVITMTPVAMGVAGPMDLSRPQSLPMALTAYLVLNMEDNALHLVSPAAITGMNMSDIFASELGLEKAAEEKGQGGVYLLRTLIDTAWWYVFWDENNFSIRPDMDGAKDLPDVQTAVELANVLKFDPVLKQYTFEYHELKAIAV